MFEARLHKRTVKFLESLDESRKRQCRQAIDQLVENPFVNRPGCDIKKLSGQKYVYRLRVGDCRFVYVAEGNIVYIMETLQKGEGL